MGIVIVGDVVREDQLERSQTLGDGRFAVDTNGFQHQEMLGYVRVGDRVDRRRTMGL